MKQSWEFIQVGVIRRVVMGLRRRSDPPPSVQLCCSQLSWALWAIALKGSRVIRSQGQRNGSPPWAAAFGVPHVGHLPHTCQGGSAALCQGHRRLLFLLSCSWFLSFIHVSLSLSVRWIA